MLSFPEDCKLYEDSAYADFCSSVLEQEKTSLTHITYQA